jgi:hypothetical protein
MAALLIVNDFDNIVGEYFVQNLDTSISGSDDFMVFHDVPQFLFNGVRKYRTICVATFILQQGLDFYLRIPMCADFDTFYEQQFELKSGFRPSRGF